LLDLTHFAGLALLLMRLMIALICADSGCKEVTRRRHKQGYRHEPGFHTLS
jgi:hypothetical protein